MTQQEAIATILVNQRVMRNGSPPISNVLEMLPAHLRAEVMDDAAAVVEGLKASHIAPDAPDGAGEEPQDQQRKWCSCIQDADQTLKEKGLRIVVPLFGPKMAQIATEKIPGVRRRPNLVLWASFCPLCGAAYPDRVKRAGHDPGSPGSPGSAGSAEAPA